MNLAQIAFLKELALFVPFIMLPVIILVFCIADSFSRNNR